MIHNQTQNRIYLHKELHTDQLQTISSLQEIATTNIDVPVIRRDACAERSLAHVGQTLKEASSLRFASVRQTVASTIEIEASTL